jgi:hypothetical protein
MVQTTLGIDGLRQLWAMAVCHEATLNESAASDAQQSIRAIYEAARPYGLTMRDVIRAIFRPRD